MDKPLNQKDIYPAEDVLNKVIDNYKLWTSLNEILKQEFPDLKSEWRYYNDGKSWLFKVTRKAATIFWLSISKGFIRVTFYFNNKTEDLIRNSELAGKYKQPFLTNENNKNTRPITIEIHKNTDLETIKLLINLKI